MIGIKRICKHCFAEFVIHPSERGPRKFCSHKCRLDFLSHCSLKRKKQYFCKNCGKSFESTFSKVYCSMECQAHFKHKKRRPRKCKTCGSLFIPDRLKSLVFCSSSCTPKQEFCAHCAGVMPDTRKRTDLYCSKECKDKASYLRNKETTNLRKKQKLEEKRKTLALAIKLWRKGFDFQIIAKQCLINEENISGFLLQSKGYKRKTNYRKSKSKWYESEVVKNARSKSFRLESHFRDHVFLMLKDKFDDVEKEVTVPGTRRKIDLVIRHGLFGFGIELKNGNRTARLDQTLGQSIIKCAAIGRLIPVCAVPDDVQPDKVFLHGCDSVGAIAGRISDVIRNMCVKCCI